MDQIVALDPPIFDYHGEVPGLLRHPSAVWLRCATSNPNPPATQMQKEQDVEGDQPAQGPNLFSEKVRRPGHLQVRLQKLLP